MTAYDYATAAAELGVSESWLRDHTPSAPLPHHKFAIDSDGKPTDRGRGEVVFYAEDIDAIKRMFQRGESVPNARVVRPVTRRRAS